MHYSSGARPHYKKCDLGSPSNPQHKILEFADPLHENGYNSHKVILTKFTLGPAHESVVTYETGTGSSIHARGKRKYQEHLHRHLHYALQSVLQIVASSATLHGGSKTPTSARLI